MKSKILYGLLSVVGIVLDGFALVLGVIVALPIGFLLFCLGMIETWREAVYCRKREIMTNIKEKEKENASKSQRNY